MPKSQKIKKNSPKKVIKKSTIKKSAKKKSVKKSTKTGYCIYHLSHRGIGKVVEKSKDWKKTKKKYQNPGYSADLRSLSCASTIEEAKKKYKQAEEKVKKNKQKNLSKKKQSGGKSRPKKSVPKKSKAKKSVVKKSRLKKSIIKKKINCEIKTKKQCKKSKKSCKYKKKSKKCVNRSKKRVCDGRLNKKSCETKPYCKYINNKCKKYSAKNIWKNKNIKLKNNRKPKKLENELSKELKIDLDENSSNIDNEMINLENEEEYK